MSERMEAAKLIFACLQALWLVEAWKRRMVIVLSLINPTNR